MKKSEAAEAMFVDFNYWENSAALNAHGARHVRNNGTQAFDSKKNQQTSPCPLRLVALMSKRLCRLEACVTKNVPIWCN
jgi:hypothetical protein